jgi:hypothetical protein
MSLVGVIGSAARRRVSGFDASTYGTLLAWLEADAITGLANDDLVTTWDGTGYNSATQGTTGLKPTYKTNQINGLPSVLFPDGDDTYLTFGTRMTTVRTVVVVDKWASTAGNYRSIFGDTSSYHYLGAEAGAALFLAGWASASVTGGTAWRNGSSIAVSSLTRNTAWAITALKTTGNTIIGNISKERTETAREFIGDRAVVLLYSDALADATIETLMEDLNTKYAAY